MILTALNMEHDWSPFLAEGETVDSQEWIISPMHPGSPTTPIVSNETSDVVFVEGMLVGMVYRLKERITTSNGRAMVRPITLRCDETC